VQYFIQSINPNRIKSIIPKHNFNWIVFSCILFLITAPSIYANSSYSWGNVRMDGGGFVSAVIASPHQEGLFYARTDVGGVYRWDAQNQVWIPLMDWVSQEDVGIYGTESFALDPQNEASLYVLGGTKYFSEGKTVILRSQDYGKTFDTTDVTSLFQAHGNGMGRQTGEKLAVDPLNSNIILCGSRSAGLFKSSDQGKTWANISTIGAQPGADLVNANGISFVLFDPNSTPTAANGASTFYMGVSATTNNLYVTHDGGATFSPITGGPANQMPHRAVLNNGKLYITYSSSPGPHSVSGGSFYSYTIATNIWQNLTPKQDGVYLGSGGQSFSHGFGGISIDPTNPNRMLLTTLCYYGGQHRYANNKDGWGDRIYLSTDGGQTWSTPHIPADKTPENVNTNANGTAWISGHAIHWAGSITFDPFNTNSAWVTSGNGVFRSDNLDANKPIWNFVSKGIEETVPLDIVSIPGGPLVTAIGDYDGSVYSDITASTPLHEPHIGTTYRLGYAPLTGAFLRAGQFTDYSTGTGITSNVMYFSEDQATTWVKLPTPKGTHGLVVLSADGEVMLHRPENASTVYRSADQGTSWDEVTGLDGQAQYARIVCDPINANVFYVLNQQGVLLRSSDKGVSFSAAGSVQDNSQNLWQASNGLIRTVPGKQGHIWAPLDQAQSWSSNGKYSTNGLALSEDGGETWSRLASVHSAQAVGIGKAAEGAPYETIFIWGVIGDDTSPLGIYRSIDKGATWERINSDAHQFGGPGNGAFVQGDMNVFGRVYMSTVGRGLIFGNLGALENSLFAQNTFQALGAPTFATMQVYQNNLHITAPSGTHQLYLYAANGKLLHSQSIAKSNAVIPLSHLPNGVLNAKLVSNHGQTVAHKTILNGI
jgi:xyloglucan-specific exo-beta-1,4-glucanase